MRWIFSSRTTPRKFNKTFRDAVLDSYIFETLDEVRNVTEDFIYDYNNHRPHDSLGGMPPVKYRNMNTKNLNIFVEKKIKHGMKAVVL